MNIIITGSIGNLYLTPITGPVIAKKYPTKSRSVLTISSDSDSDSDESIFTTPTNARKVNIMDIVVPITKIKR